jgi:hypothetical protein
MNKQVLSPFDCDMCAMIEDITKQEIEVTASDTSIRLSWAQNGSEGNDKAEGQRIEAVKHAMPTFDDPGRMNAVIDELADLNAVVFHSAAILGIPQRDLLEMAYDKVKGRQTDPNYKRTHPHEPNKGAGIYVAKNINPKNNRAMKEKSFAQELAALINRHGIDAKMNTNDWILADVAIDALNAYGKANQLREKMANAPEPGKDDCDCPACTLRRALQGKAQPGGKEYRKPEAFDVPKEVEAMAAFFADMFPGSEIQIQRVDLKKNPRNKCRAKNKRKGGRRNEK